MLGHVRIQVQFLITALTDLTVVTSRQSFYESEPAMQISPDEKHLCNFPSGCWGKLGSWRLPWFRYLFSFFLFYFLSGVWVKVKCSSGKEREQVSAFFSAFISRPEFSPIRFNKHKQNTGISAGMVRAPRMIPRNTQEWFLVRLLSVHFLFHLRCFGFFTE